MTHIKSFRSFYQEKEAIYGAGEIVNKSLNLILKQKIYINLN